MLKPSRGTCPCVRVSFRTMGIKIALRLPDRLRRFLALWTPCGIPLLRKFQILLSYPMRSKNSPNCHFKGAILRFRAPIAAPRRRRVRHVTRHRRASAVSRGFVDSPRRAAGAPRSRSSIVRAAPGRPSLAFVARSPLTRSCWTRRRRLSKAVRALRALGKTQVGEDAHESSDVH